MDWNTGRPGSIAWDSTQHRPAADSRRIFTTNGNGQPTPFRWATLDEAWHRRLGGEIALKSAREHGDLGVPAAAYSSPIFVGPPSPRWSSEASYSRFANDGRTRIPMVYVLERRGALFAFDAATGTEEFVFIGDGYFSETASAVDPPTQPVSPPAVGHAYFKDAWHTVLVAGNTRLGGSLYAFDVSSPSSFASSEQRPEQSVLWRFNDIDLGHASGQPVIARLHNGEWATIFANGYSSGGMPILYVASAADGSLTAKLRAKAQDKATESPELFDGLSTPAAVDSNADGTVDFVYAGDLRGNLWKFDLTDVRPENWHVALDGEPLFRARSRQGELQAIVTRPEVTRGFDGMGAMVFFAGNQLASDAQGASSLYGIADRAEAPVPDRAALRSLGSIGQTTVSGAQVRTITPAPAAPNSTGWFLDLASGGHEDVITHPTARDGRVVFGTQVKQGSCDSVLTWTMAITEPSLTPPVQPTFDINRDGLFNPTDAIAPQETVIGIGTYAPLQTAITTPTIIEGRTSAGMCAHLVHVTDGADAGTSLSCRAKVGRHSWRRLR